jgi:lysyl-tRNA synthetase class I
MRRIFEFACENGHKTERLTSYEMVSFTCECGAQANRILSAPAVKLEGWSGSFPGAANKFDRIHREKLAAERKANS